MKSNTALKSFKIFLKSLTVHQSQDLSRKSSNMSTNNSKAKFSIGSEYLVLYQLITIYQIMQTSQSKAWEKSKIIAAKGGVSPIYPQISMEQKNLLVEVVRRLDDDLDLCFPNMPRETFYETFRELITLPNKDMQDKAIISKSNFKRGTTVHQQFKRASANIGFDKESIESGLDYLQDESLMSKQSSRGASTWKSKNSLRLIDRDSRASARISILTDKMNFE